MRYGEVDMTATVSQNSLLLMLLSSFQGSIKMWVMVSLSLLECGWVDVLDLILSSWLNETFN